MYLLNIPWSLLVPPSNSCKICFQVTVAAVVLYTAGLCNIILLLLRTTIITIDFDAEAHQEDTSMIWYLIVYLPHLLSIKLEIKQNTLLIYSSYVYLNFLNQVSILYIIKDFQFVSNIILSKKNSE